MAEADSGGGWQAWGFFPGMITGSCFRNWGPFSQTEDISWFTLMGLVPMSAGLSSVQMYPHCSTVEFVSILRLLFVTCMLYRCVWLRSHPRQSRLSVQNRVGSSCRSSSLCICFVAVAPSSAADSSALGIDVFPFTSQVCGRSTEFAIT